MTDTKQGMVERVARAMWFDFVMNHGFPSPYPTWDEMADSDMNKRDVRSNARAAIEAMREPTEAMVLSSASAFDANIYMGGPTERAKQKMVAAYTTMISAALSENKQENTP